MFHIWWWDCVELIIWVYWHIQNKNQYNLCSCTVHVDHINFFIVQLMHIIIIKLLKSFKIIIIAPTCFSLPKPSSGSSQPVLCQSYSVDFSYIYCYLKLSVLWLHICSILLCVWIVHCAEFQSTWITGWNRYAATIPTTSNNNICNQSQQCNFGEAWTWVLPDDGLCKLKHVGATIIILNDFNSLTVS